VWAVKPASTEYVPCGQAWHAVIPVAEYVPALQLKQESASTPENLPAAQGSHSVTPVPLLNVPCRHAWQVVTP
jgi:hypothetical protein